MTWGVIMMCPHVMTRSQILVMMTLVLWQCGRSESSESQLGLVPIWPVPASLLHLSLSDCNWEGRRPLVRGQHTGHLWQCGKILMDPGTVSPPISRHPSGSTGVCFVSRLSSVAWSKCQIVIRAGAKRKCALFIDAAIVHCTNYCRK